MNVSAAAARRAVLLALVVTLMAIFSVASQLASAGPAPKPVAARYPLDPIKVHHPAPALPAPTTTAPPEPEPEPEPEPAPPPPPPAPKKKAPAPAPQSAPKTAAVGGSEVGQMVSMVNQYRAANGLEPLSKAGDAMAKAQQQANNMAAQGRMYHSSSMSSGLNGGWSAVGENVGVGGSVGQVESMFEGSGPHRANLLSAKYNQIGVGVAYGNDGQLYVCQVFVGR